MDPRLQASFIPKKPLMEHSSAGAKPRSSISLFSFVSILIFVIALVLSGAVFFYNSYLTNSANNVQNNIEATEQKYTADSGSINSYLRLDDRIKTATGLLSSHIAASEIFALLEQDTVQNVQFLSFKFGLTGTSTPTLSLSGQARSFNSVSVQSNVFSADPLVQQPVFSDVGLDSNGDVLFQVDADLSPSVISYVNSLPQSQTVQLPTATTTASSTANQ